MALQRSRGVLVLAGPQGVEGTPRLGGDIGGNGKAGLVAPDNITYEGWADTFFIGDR